MRGFRIGASLAVAAAAVAALGVGITPAKQAARIEPPRQMRQKKAKPRYEPLGSNTTLHATNGARECARRRRQIAAGSLTESNGLVR